MTAGGELSGAARGRSGHDDCQGGHGCCHRRFLPSDGFGCQGEDQGSAGAGGRRHHRSDRLHAGQDNQQHTFLHALSAHAANSIAVTTLIITTFKFSYKKWISLLLIFWVAIFAYSRIYLGVHYPLDTIVGLCFGFIFGKTASCIINYFKLLRS